MKLSSFTKKPKQLKAPKLLIVFDIKAIFLAVSEVKVVISNTSKVLFWNQKLKNVFLKLAQTLSKKTKKYQFYFSPAQIFIMVSLRFLTEIFMRLKEIDNLELKRHLSLFDILAFKTYSCLIQLFI